jgi:hypothetical protein
MSADVVPLRAAMARRPPTCRQVEDEHRTSLSISHGTYSLWAASG